MSEATAIASIFFGIGLMAVAVYANPGWIPERVAIIAWAITITILAADRQNKF
jgi:hypothetical protein